MDVIKIVSDLGALGILTLVLYGLYAQGPRAIGAIVSLSASLATFGGKVEVLGGKVDGLGCKVDGLGGRLDVLASDVEELRKRQSLTGEELAIVAEGVAAVREQTDPDIDTDAIRTAQRALPRAKGSRPGPPSVRMR